MEDDFSSDGISIRRYQVTDIPLVYEAVRESINEISPWLPWCHPDYSMEDSSTWVLSRDEAWANEVECSFVITDAPARGFSRLPTSTDACRSRKTIHVWLGPDDLAGSYRNGDCGDRVGAISYL